MVIAWSLLKEIRDAHPNQILNPSAKANTFSEYFSVSREAFSRIFLEFCSRCFLVFAAFIDDGAIEFKGRGISFALS